MRTKGFWITLTAVVVLAGTGLAWFWPRFPLLVYWLTVAMLFGFILALVPAFGGIQRRSKYIVVTFAVLITSSLITTQFAARRVISSTHLVYHGVHLVGVDSLTIGSGPITTDIRLLTIAPSQLPWAVSVTRSDDGWLLDPVYGVEQLRVRNESTQSLGRSFSVARSAVVGPGDAVVVIGPDNSVADSLRVTPSGIESSTGSQILFDAPSEVLEHRYNRWLRSGTVLSKLAGRRSGSSIVYERFVRVQRLGRESINGESAPRLQRRARYLLSAAPPYRLEGDVVSDQPLLVGDSAFVEVRNADGTWRFALMTAWRRGPSAQRGIAVLFDRNPRRLDTPLPAGMSCADQTACGAISLRRLPPPVSHVALGHAGFDPERYGLLGMLRVSDRGFEVIMPDESHSIERGLGPTAVPVTPLEYPAANDSESRWVLLAASGQRDTILEVAAIGAGLLLLIGAVYSVVRSLTARAFRRPSRDEERAIGGGLAVLLGLILTRVTIGARVAFFDPFLDRGIETAVGLCTAIAVVIAGLMTLKIWLPPFLASANNLVAGHSSLLSTARALLSWARTFVHSLIRPSMAVVAIALVLLTWTTGPAAWMGILTGGIVVSMWVCLAWIAAFTGDHFDTFERGVHAIVEQHSPRNSARYNDPGQRGVFAHLWYWQQELALIGTAAAMVLGHSFPEAVGVLGLLVVIFAGAMIFRRSGHERHSQPDWYAAVAGMAAFATLMAALRIPSTNGSLGAFILVVFIVLSSVRIGRAVAGQIGKGKGQATSRSNWFIQSSLLVTPMLLLGMFAALDMGLVLVLVIPIACATLLATGVKHARQRWIVPVVVLVIALLAGKKVVLPSLDSIHRAESHAEQSAAFAGLSEFFGLRIPGLATPMDRAAARSVATRDPELAERMLVAAGPGSARDLLIPSIEQVWGTRSYASSGWWGEGLGQAVVGGRGVAESVSYAENTFSVFVLGEHGAIGGILVLSLYLLLAVAVGTLIIQWPADTHSYRASRALFLVAALIVAFPATYVALSNLGVVPITGQNMPFLGLNAWSDVAISAGVIGILITGALRGVEERK